ncbi:MAG: hypothetical protein H6Q61_791 [Firmicutes bacterium]|nr:hypothetical protein [Bacillota bacterium]
MFIIRKESLHESGFHPFESQSHRKECWLEDYVEVPEHLVALVLESCGWCDLTLYDDVLTGVMLTAKPEQVHVSTPEQDRDEMLVDLAYRATLLELGVN